MKMNILALAVAAAAVVAAASGNADARGQKPLLDQQLIASGVQPTAGGNCTTPTAITAVPFSDTGTTVGGTNIINSIPSGCSDYTATQGPNMVYSFTAGTGANLTFTVTPTTATYDPSIYLVSSCGTGTTCITGSDSTYDGEAETFSVSTLTAGTTYYLHVDSFYPSTNTLGQGAYTLDVTGTLPVQLQEFQID